MSPLGLAPAPTAKALSGLVIASCTSLVRFKILHCSLELVPLGKRYQERLAYGHRFKRIEAFLVLPGATGIFSILPPHLILYLC